MPPFNPGNTQLRRLPAWGTTLSLLLVFCPAVAQACPDCAADEAMPLQLAANARGALMGLLTLALLLVVAVLVAGACLKYTRRLLFAGALLFGGGVGAFLEGTLVEKAVSWREMAPLGIDGSLVRLTEWFSRGNFSLYCIAAALLGCVVLFTEAPNVLSVTRNRLVPGGMVAGLGVFNLFAGLWHSSVFNGQLFNGHADGGGTQAWVAGFLVAGVVMCAASAVLVVPVLKHRSALVARTAKRINHAH